MTDGARFFMSQCAKKCTAVQVCNPESRRCVLRTGAIGKRILGNGPKKANGPKERYYPKKANKPKRPKSSYFFFLDDVRGPIKARNPGATIGQLGKLMGLEWGKLSEAEKAKYAKSYAKNKIRYEQEMAAYTM